MPRPPRIPPGVPQRITFADNSISDVGVLVVGNTDISLVRLPDGVGGYSFFARPLLGNADAVELRDGQQTIGRYPGMTLHRQLAADPFVSNRHVVATALRGQGQLILNDTSSNGTFFLPSPGVSIGQAFGAVTQVAEVRDRRAPAAPAVPDPAALQVMGRLDGRPQQLPPAPQPRARQSQMHPTDAEMALLLAGNAHWGGLRFGQSGADAVAFGAATRAQLLNSVDGATGKSFAGEFSDSATMGVPYVHDGGDIKLVAVLDGAGESGRVASRIARLVLAAGVQDWASSGYAFEVPIIFWRQIDEMSKVLHHEFGNGDSTSRATLVAIGEPNEGGRSTVWANGVGNTVAVIARADGTFEQLTVDDSVRGLRIHPDGTITRTGEGTTVYSNLRNLPRDRVPTTSVPTVGSTYITDIGPGDQILIGTTRVYGRNAEDEPRIGLAEELSGVRDVAHAPLDSVRHLLGESLGNSDALAMIVSAGGAGKWSSSNPGVRDVLSRPRTFLPMDALRALGLHNTGSAGHPPMPPHG